MADVIITPNSGLVDFQSSSTSQAQIQLDGSNNLNITNSGGNLTVGDGSSDVYLGNGITTVDLVFQNSGEIRGSGSQTITLGTDGDTIKIGDGVTFEAGDYLSILQAQFSMSGGGDITWNGSYLKWTQRVICIPVNKNGGFSTNGYFDITCPTSGTITYYNSSNVTTTVTCTSNGIPMSTWEGLWYKIPIGSTYTSLQANFVVANYGNSTWRPTSEWVLIATRNGDSTSQSIRWLPGQINFPASGSNTWYSDLGYGTWAGGTSGSSGSSGSSGNNGNSGTSGSSGSSGNNGNNGNSGTSGTSGNNGNNGNSGTSGSSGSSGNNGNNGNSGTSGTSGNNGNNGNSGTSGSSGSSGNSATGSLADGTAAAPSLTFASDTNTGLYRYGVDTIGFSTAGALEMVLNANGNLGIGTASPTHLLHVSGKARVGSIGSVKLTTNATANGSMYFIPDSGNYHVWNLSSGVTMTFTGQSSSWPAGYFVPFTLVIKYAGSATVNWNNYVLWAGGQAPVLTGVSGKADVFSLCALSNTLYIGSVIAQNVASSSL